jgi:hypothetical protein
VADKRQNLTNDHNNNVLERKEWENKQEEDILGI